VKKTGWRVKDDWTVRYQRHQQEVQLVLALRNTAAVGVQRPAAVAAAAAAYAAACGDLDRQHLGG